MSTSGVGAGRHTARSHTGGPSEPAGVWTTQEPRRRDRAIIGVIATATAVCLFSAGALVGQMGSVEAPAAAAALPSASPSAPPSSTPTAARTSGASPAPTAPAPAATVTVTAEPSPTVTFPAPVPAAAIQRPADAGAPPVQVMIPDLQIDQGLLGLRVTPDRSLEIPESADDLGWWRDGPAPGEAGAALVVGHVDSTEGPGVFYHLSTLKEGAVVSVRRADGRTVRFAVTGTQVFAKDDFPDDLVYRTDGKPSLHLVTCGGTFDRETGHYRDNVVVFADLIEEAPAPESTPDPEPAPESGPAPEPAPDAAPAEASTPGGVTAEEKAGADKVNAAIAEAIRRAAEASAQQEEDDR